MAELRALIEALGFHEVRTVLNSGNVVFEATRPNVAGIAAAIAAAITARSGFSVPVIVLTLRELNAVIAENALPRAVAEPSRFLVAFVTRGSVLKKARVLLADSWAPDAMCVGSRAAYLWCVGGVIESRLAQAFARITGEEATTRNWATVLRLQAAASRRENTA
jgi:uncharacterized protein (DUF1697 family)